MSCDNKKGDGQTQSLAVQGGTLHFLIKSVLRGRASKVNSNCVAQEVSGTLCNPQLCYCVQRVQSLCCLR